MSGPDVRAIDGSRLRRGVCPTLGQEFRVVVGETAFDQAIARGTSDTSREVGGVLVGEALVDDAGPFLQIDATIDALHAEEGGAELTFTHATWDHIHREMDSRWKGKSVVGWYHTHPGFGIFLSDRDQFIQQSFFDLPFQVALVYDPRSREHGVFAWRDGKPSRLRRYWIGAREQLWDGSRSTTARAEESVPSRTSEPLPAAAPRDDSERGERDPDFASLGIGGLIVLMLGGIFGWWLGGRSAAEALTTAKLEILKAGETGAQGERAAINSELIGLLRGALDDRGLRAPLDEAMKDLDAVAKGFGPSPPKEASAAFQRARERLQRLRDDQLASRAMLAQIEGAVRDRSVSPAALARQIDQTRGALGQLYVDVAAAARKAGDAERADRLLVAAKRLDPQNAERYEKQRTATGGGQ